MIPAGSSGAAVTACLRLVHRAVSHAPTASAITVGVKLVPSLRPSRSPSPGLSAVSVLLLAVLSAVCTTEEREAPAEPPRPALRRTDPPKVERGYVTSDDGARLYVQKIGKGDQVVVVPYGFRMFDAFRRLANDRRTLISYDRRNRGRSDTIEDLSRISVRENLRDLETLRRHFGLDRFVLIGSDDAGFLAVLYALEHPRHVERIVQIGPTPFALAKDRSPEGDEAGVETAVDPAQRSRLDALRASGWHERHPREYCEEVWLVERVDLVGDRSSLDRLGGSDCHLHNEWPARLARHREAQQRSLASLRLEESSVQHLKIPVLTLHGTLDRDVSFHAAEIWTAMLPDARLLPIEGAAHRPWVDEPDLVFSAIESFLGGQWPSGMDGALSSP